MSNRLYTGYVVTPPQDWQVLIQAHHPAYISWEQYQRNLAQLKSNQTRADELGFAREGTSLLSGLLICGKCSCRMSVQYRRQQHHQYNICCQEMTIIAAITSPCCLSWLNHALKPTGTIAEDTAISQPWLIAA